MFYTGTEGVVALACVGLGGFGGGRNDWALEISGKANGERAVQVKLQGEGHSAGVLVLDPEIWPRLVFFRFVFCCEEKWLQGRFNFQIVIRC